VTDDRAGRILVVDDDPFNRDVLQQELEALGHEVLTADNGAAGLAMIDGDDVDIVLLDIMMPGLSGFDVLERLRRDDGKRELPIIVISALHDVDSIVRGIKLGADDYLPKPFEPVILEARIEQALAITRWRRRERAYLAEVERERARADELLDSMLPPSAVRELKDTGRVAPHRCEDVAVMFLDVREFSGKAIRLPPDELVSSLGVLVEAADAAAAARGLERIKVIGDAVMVTGGLLAPHPDAVDACIECAFAIFATAPESWKLRAGVAYGSVTAGIVGTTHFAFDIWGPVVNAAARLVALKDEDVVFLDEAAAQRVARPLPPPQSVDLKGIGVSNVYGFRRDG